MNIVFMGSPEFAVPALKELISSKYDVVAVYTQPDKPVGRGRIASLTAVKRVALEHGLEVRQVKSFAEAGTIASLAQLNPDVIVVAAFGQILPPQVLTIPPFGCINLHPSLLPRHRGPTPIPAAILAGDDWTGASIMLLDEGIDSGPILAQRRVAIAPQDTTDSLARKLAQIAAQLLEETMPGWLSHSLTPQPQREEDATYTKLLSKEEGEIDWQIPAPQIWCRVRAFYPWPGCYTTWRGKMLKIVLAAPITGERGDPGGVLSLARGEVGVQCGEGILRLQRLQLEGKREMAADEFLRGQRDFVGSLLPC
ncbi:MAG: methionyl-tRNA formyltransferase [Dehalococcoidia bacterium]|nr:methionyl-tRNA formyltransferase [Dehalococcoidia bacterium]